VLGDSYPQCTTSSRSGSGSFGYFGIYEEREIQRREQRKPFFEIRIGIHSGPLVAGVVGVKKFAYDIWGDTVNTASRMESKSEVGKINISGNTYQLVQNHFACHYRGKIQAKHKGEIDMYFIEKSLT
jgi:class 3 adenylate cyclase